MMPGSIKNPLTLRKMNIKRNQPLIHIQLQEYKCIAGREALLRFVIYPSKYEKKWSTPGQPCLICMQTKFLTPTGLFWSKAQIYFYFLK